MEGSLRKCEILLEQSPLPNIITAWLQQGVAAGRYTTDEAKDIETSMHREFRILKENLRIFESQSQVKVFSAISGFTNRPSEDVPMAAARCDEICDELLKLKDSLETTLMKEKLKYSNHVIRIASLAKTCEDQENQLQEKYLISKKIIHLRRENVSLSNKIKDQLLDMNLIKRAIRFKEEIYSSQLESISNYNEEFLFEQQSLERQTEQIERLNHTITKKKNRFELKKNEELIHCKNDIRALSEDDISQLKEELASNLSYMDSMKIKYRESVLNRCSLKEAEECCRKDLEEKLKVVSLAKQACAGEKGLVRQAVTDEVLADAEKQRQEEHKRGIQQLTEKRDVCRSKLSSNHDELSECKQNLHAAVSELKRIIFLSEAPPLPLQKRDKKKMNALLTCHGEMLQKSGTDQAQMPLKKQSESDEQIIRQFTSKVLKMEAHYLDPLFKMHLCKDARQQVEDKEKEEKMKRRRLKQKERSQQKLQVGEDQYDIQ